MMNCTHVGEHSHSHEPTYNVADPAIKLSDVGVTRDGMTLLEGISASAPRGSVTAIIGPNGAGKTTLLRAILNLIPHTGRIEMIGRDKQPPRIGYVPQRLDFDRSAPIRVIDFLLLGFQRWPLWLGINRSWSERAERTLERVQAHHLLLRPIGKLSGGELQRVQLALALLLDPEILLLDEPVSGVDITGERLFCDLLDAIHQEAQLTMVLVSHDLSVVSQHATHVWCLNKQLRVEGRPRDVLSGDMIHDVFGHHMAVHTHHADHEHDTGMR